MERDIGKTKSRRRMSGALAATAATITAGPALGAALLLHRLDEPTWTAVAAATGWTVMTTLLSGGFTWAIAPRKRGGTEKDVGAMPVIGLAGMGSIIVITITILVLTGRIS